MSMNLCFYTKTKRPRLVEFPFQTPTDWTWDIYNEKDIEKRIDILKSKMKTNSWLDQGLVQECSDMLRDANLELSFI